MKALSLFELNNLVREVISTAFDNEYWVEAELSELREVRGHCYMELIQKPRIATFLNGLKNTKKIYLKTLLLLEMMY